MAPAPRAGRRPPGLARSRNTGGVERIGPIDVSQRLRGRRVCDVMVHAPKLCPADAPAAEVRALFDDDHVHMALLVAADGRLVTTIERADLAAASSLAAAQLGSLAGRTTHPHERLERAVAALQRGRRRRLAVVDLSGRLVGLLCLKQDGTGFCTDEGIRSRAGERAAAAGAPGPAGHRVCAAAGAVAPPGRRPREDHMAESEFPADGRRPGGGGSDAAAAASPGLPGEAPAEADEQLVAGDDGSVVPLAGGLPDTGSGTLRDVDPAYGRIDVAGTPAPRRKPDEPGEAAG